MMATPSWIGLLIIVGVGVLALGALVAVVAMVWGGNRPHKGPPT